MSDRALKSPPPPCHSSTAVPPGAMSRHCALVREPAVESETRSNGRKEGIALPGEGKSYCQIRLSPYFSLPALELAIPKL